MDLQTVLYENKIKMRKEFIKKAKLEAKKRRKEKITNVIIALILVFMGYIALKNVNEWNSSQIDKCAVEHGYTYCINELG